MREHYATDAQSPICKDWERQSHGFKAERGSEVTTEEHHQNTPLIQQQLMGKPWSVFYVSQTN